MHRIVLVIALLPATAFADDAADDGGYRLYGADPCPRHDGIVGRRSCPRYGEWAIDWPAVTVTFGLGVRHFSRARGPDAVVRVVTPTTIDDPSSIGRYSISEQVAIAPSPLMFFAFEVEFGVVIGSSLIDRGEYMTGISLGTHTNAFDGR